MATGERRRGGVVGRERGGNRKSREYRVQSTEYGVQRTGAKGTEVKRTG
jgi:hypothetical protein